MTEKEISLVPDSASEETVQAFLEEVMEEAEVSMKLQNKMNVAVDEIWSNIVNYSGASKAEAKICIDTDQIRVTLKDNGVPFDPLTHEDPDVSLSAEERMIGGLGIFMTKKLMNDVRYCYENGFNTVFLVLNR